MSDHLDPRLTVARPDRAASSLRGRVTADDFVEGERYTVCVETLDMKRRPRPDALLDTQVLYGEDLMIYDDDDGWGWAQADRDGYVGYVAMSGLRRSTWVATHRVIVDRTFIYPAPDMKQPIVAALPLDGRVHVEDRHGLFARIEGRGFVIGTHLAPLGEVTPDFVSIAQRLVGVPYLWGGKSPLGLDCSGLVQLSCSLAGLRMPRDTDMQEQIGERLPDDTILERGDLVFWRGHVGIMCENTSFVHANGHHMLVAHEPLMLARQRIIDADGGDVTSFRRPPRR